MGICSITYVKYLGLRIYVHVREPGRRFRSVGASERDWRRVMPLLRACQGP